MRVTDWCDTADDWGMGGEEDNDGWGGGAKQNTPVKEETGAAEAAGRAGQSCILNQRFDTFFLLKFESFILKDAIFYI